MHGYLLIVTSYQRVAHIAKDVFIQKRCKQYVAKQRRLERKFLGISDSELLRYDHVNRLYLLG